LTSLHQFILLKRAFYTQFLLVIHDSNSIINISSKNRYEPNYLNICLSLFLAQIHTNSVNVVATVYFNF
jgi:hypothetical protein